MLAVRRLDFRVRCGDRDGRPEWDGGLSPDRSVFVETPAVPTPSLTTTDIPSSTADSGHFLSTHVWSDGQGDVHALYRPAETDELWPLDSRKKAMLEIDFWLRRLERLWRERERGEGRPRTPSTHERLGAEAIARTYRILLGMKALFFPDAPVPAVIADRCVRWRAELEPLAAALDWNDSAALVRRCLRGSYALAESGWSVSWPLLLIRAAAWSQVKWEDQPYLWEAHSALWAKREHSRLGVMSENELRILTFLIRYQSAPGQWARTTGDLRFWRASEALEDRLSHSKTGDPAFASSLAAKDLIDALGVLGHAHEFRNWPVDEPASPQRSRLLRRGGYLTSEGSPTPFHEFWALDTSLRQPDAADGLFQQPRFTWSYVQSLLDRDRESLDRFRRIAEQCVIDAVDHQRHHFEDFSSSQITTFALDRELLGLKSLRAAVTAQIQQVQSPEDFDRFFNWKPERAPFEFDREESSRSKYEYSIVVRLKDHITAKHMVFADLPVDPLANEVSDHHPAHDYCRLLFNDQQALQRVVERQSPWAAEGELASLTDRRPLPEAVFAWITGDDVPSRGESLGSAAYRYLFGRALDEDETQKIREPTAWDIYESLFLTGVLDGFIRWARGGGDNYCPTHLIGRFLQVSYRMRGSCVELPLERDGRRTVLTLPRPPDGVDRKAPAVRAIARYVCGAALNMMMGTTVTELHMGLKNLQNDTDGSFWRRAILDEYEENSFQTLLGLFVDNFHQIAHHVRFNRELPPKAEFLQPRASRPLEMLKALMSGPYLGRELIVGGIDIGAATTKVAFYKLTLEGTEVRFDRWSYHPDGDESRTRSHDLKFPTESEAGQYANAGEFCERLLSEIDQRLKATGGSLDDIAAFGIAWPGPVRDGVVRDWSGILRNFRSHRDAQRDTPIGQELKELLTLDICGSFSKILAERVRSRVPVIMINDGDSHAVGELTKLAAAGRSSDHRTQVLLKAGSGTAGSVTRQGALLAGLMEFGKLLVNLAYRPADSYPTGLAHRYFSGRTLPQLAKIALPHLAELDPPITSAEIGLLAELVDSPCDAGGGPEDGMRRLVEECGKILLAQTLPGRIDVAELSELLTEEGWAERWRSRQVIESHFSRFGYEARKAFTESIFCSGMIRLEAVLQLRPELQEDFRLLLHRGPSLDWTAFPSGSSLQLTDNLRTVIDRLLSCAHQAQRCVERMGDFLGDLAVLLHDEYQMDAALIGGGVVSRKTGRTVVHAARDRILQYSNMPAVDVTGNTLTFPESRGDVPETAEPAASPSAQGAVAVAADSPERRDPLGALDSGTLGAAVRAALECLRCLRLDGLNALHAMIYNLTFDDQLVLEDDRVHLQRPPDGVAAEEAAARDWEFQHFALSQQDVRDYLDNQADVLGIVPMPPEAEGEETGHFVYTRLQNS